MAEPSRSHARRAAILAVLVTLATVTTALAATVTSAPTITGAPFTAAELRAGEGSWTPADADAAYAWLRCNTAGGNCVGISGACGRRYVVREADEGHTLRVRLTVTNGSTDSADSAQTAVITRPTYPIPPGPDENTCTQVTPTGPGQGTFSSGAQTPAGTTPPPDTALPFIDPFPIVRIAGRFDGRRTKLRRVTVTAPRGARIRISCKGRGCPYKRRAIAVRLIRVKALQRTYRPKATIEIRVTQPRRIGKYTRIRTRRGKAPVRRDRCLMPGKTKPVRCPEG